MLKIKKKKKKIIISLASFSFSMVQFSWVKFAAKELFYPAYYLAAARNARVCIHTHLICRDAFE